MNDFGCIDYKKPLGLEDDLRSSTYRGHLHMTDTMMGTKLNPKFKEIKPYYVDPKLENMRTSVYQGNYVFQFGDPNLIANPTLDRKVQFMKNYEDRRLRFIARPQLPASSVSHQDYLWRPYELPDPPTAIALPAAVAASHVVIDRQQPGYIKLLDSTATTSRLDYVHRTPAQVMGSVAAHDNITFWNWHKIEAGTKRVFPGRDETMVNHLAAKECPKRRCEFPSTVQRVPHTGMTTETRSNYMEPMIRAIDFDLAHIRNSLVHQPAMPWSETTEYNMYGSGKRTQQYI